MPKALGPSSVNQAFAMGSRHRTCRSGTPRTNYARRQDHGEREAEFFGSASAYAFEQTPEIVAPEREKPRNGRHSPWTAPIHAALRTVIA